MAPRGRFNRHQEGHRFLTPMRSIAPSPRNLREEWEYDTEEFAEFKANVEATGTIQDPAVSSVEAFVAKYPQHAGEFGPEIEWVLIAGERRHRVQLDTKDPDDTMPVVLRNKLLDQGDFALLSENTYRKGWDPLQEATILERIRHEEGLTYDQILERLGGKFAAVKRRSDISKRIKLLSLEDGPLRRAIRLGDIGLEPAYTLVTRLKTQDQIERGWELMRTTGVTASAACDELVGSRTPSTGSQTPAGSLTADPGHTPQPRDASIQTGSGSFVDETSTPPDAAAASRSFVDETPPPGAAAGSAGFVDETSTPPEARVPNQPQRVPAGQPTDRAAPPRDPAPEPTAVQARLGAYATMLADYTWPALDNATRAVAVHTVLHADAGTLEAAAQIAGAPAPATGDRLDYLATLATTGINPLKIAYAVALVTTEVSPTKP